jgi:lysophospholipase L1-like esterase
MMTPAAFVKAAATVYRMLFAVIYLGLVFHRSDVPRVGPYSLRYLGILTLALAGSLPPYILLSMMRLYGASRAAQAALAAMALTAVAYIAASTSYYYTQVHEFDPFLQAPTPGPLFTPKRPGAVRILALGGSTTRNANLPEADRYPAVLERLLRERIPAVPIEVFNGGMDWFTAKHAHINYVTNLREWEPDVVLVMSGINDLCRSFTDPDVTIGSYNALWSHFYGPSIHGAKPPPFEAYVLDRAAPYLYSSVEFVRYAERDVPLSAYVSIDSVRGHLRRLARDAANDGAAVVLMTEPSLYKPAMSPEERNALWIGRAYTKSRTGVMAYDYASPESLARAMDAMNMATKDVGQAQGVPVIDLASRIEKSLDNFSDDVHYHPQGARRVAEEVADQLIRRGLIRPRGGRP